MTAEVVDLASRRRPGRKSASGRKAVTSQLVTVPHRGPAGRPSNTSVAHARHTADEAIVRAAIERARAAIQLARERWQETNSAA